MLPTLVGPVCVLDIFGLHVLPLLPGCLARSLCFECWWLNFHLPQVEMDAHRNPSVPLLGLWKDCDPLSVGRLSRGGRSEGFAAESTMGTASFLETEEGGAGSGFSEPFILL